MTNLSNSQLAELRRRFAPHGIRIGRDPVRAVRVLGDAVLQLRATVVEREAAALAGDQYKRDLIAATLAAGRRTQGDGFNTERWRGILEDLDVDGIRTIGEDFGLAQHELLNPDPRAVEDPEAYRA